MSTSFPLLAMRTGVRLETFQMLPNSVSETIKIVALVAENKILYASRSI